MDVVPKEMLLEIFKYLSFHDLLSLSEVCSTFNLLISSSDKLLSKIPVFLQISPSKIDVAVNQWKSGDIAQFIVENLKFGTRKYSKLFIGDINSEIVVKICELLGLNVKEITFKRGSHDLETVRRILIKTSNVKRLKFCRRSVKSEFVNFESTELPQLALDELILESIGSQVFHVLKNCTLIKLEGTIG
jgi:hypothetical protein